MEEEEQKQKMRFSGHWGDLRLPLLRRSGGGPRQGRSLQIHGKFPRGWLIGLPTIQQQNAQLLSKFITDLHERNKV